MNGRKDEALFFCSVPDTTRDNSLHNKYDILQVLEEMRDEDGLKFYSDVYTKLYDSYYKLKEEKTANEEKIHSLTVSYTYKYIEKLGVRSRKLSNIHKVSHLMSDQNLV
jgi:hypothetical protein